MTFEHWWASITQAERNILTEGYARYVWNTAQLAIRNEPKDPVFTPKLKDERQLDLFRDA